ncbi:PTS sugar transporter subunit IIC [Clostridium brassicae]|uniref:Permease IIC component n=1 Tax=Clostridium brassicae TaxID=2999072 RepID=A0ABT4DCC0_9CLOT|nr:PTS sugar transporter subunit IIC [Clostridium brassicae]MCY6959932.1 PTS sugar transporter subunit IIC [Clostridium brassicae]
MQKLIDFLEKHFVPVAGKIGAQRHLVAIRDGFAVIMPLIIAGSLGVLINSFPIKSYQNFMIGIFGKGWTNFGGNLSNGTIGLMSLLIVCTVSYNLAKSYDADALSSAMVSFASLFMLYAPSLKDPESIPRGFMGATGLFVALFVALITTEIFVRLMKNPKLVIKMPDGVPPAVSRSFAALFPGIIVLVIWAIFQCILSGTGVGSAHQLIYDAIQAPLMGFADSLGSAIVISLLVHVLWFFGLHGTNILAPVFNTVYLTNAEQNIKAFQAGAEKLPHIVTSPFFDAFVHLGGAGATIGLVIAIYISSKRKEKRMVANLSAAPGIFNINEPMMFGLPIVLNAWLVIPFILIPIILTIITYFAMATGLVPKTIALMPWQTPPIIGGFIVTGSIKGALLAAFNLFISVVIYIPFISLGEKMEDKKNRNKEKTVKVQNGISQNK